LVFNDTRVIPARVLTRKPTGGAIELVFLEAVGPNQWRCLARGAVKRDMLLTVDATTTVRVLSERAADSTVLVATPDDTLAFLERHGHIPLPHYIDRDDQPADRERYQTMFARAPGAVAAPTAGLHFTPAIVARLAARDITIAPLTLHVGLGTFEPIRVDDIREHRMHRERFTIPAATWALVRDGRPVVALGTTALRALESAALDPEFTPDTFRGTELFVYPGAGHEFRVASHLITNFHLPESTLLMLVCAFAGTDRVLAAYRHAVATRYRFFSYGDAMLVHT
ncbi:MAG: tRNA preQ1(34) S-adenosylmethionine ribosyltransferase-isomerase QueA, partial [Proteobacteria bacterium]|nr:tRNA preQ1(34) S-adenosylmethionine ribosyltransferase-isomerase QueA [Pseudomonadota bacterium]